MQFEFRLRFHLLPDDRLDSAEPSLSLPVGENHLRLTAWRKDTLIQDNPRLVLIGGPYDSPENAVADALRTRRAVLLWALQRRLAIDLGESKRRGGLTPAGESWLEQQFGAPVRQQVHGIDVYQQQDGQLFVDISVSPGLKIDPQGASESIARWYNEDRNLSGKQELAAELYCSAHFDAPLRSRFLTLMTALEALLDHQPRSQEVIALVESLEQSVMGATLDKHAKQSILSSLEWLHQESIGQAGRRTATDLLPTGKYGGMSSSKYFRECYELRSTIVHSGRVPKDVDLLDVTNELHRFVGDLLHAAMGVTPT